MLVFAFFYLPYVALPCVLLRLYFFVRSFGCVLNHVLNYLHATLSIYFFFVQSFANIVFFPLHYALFYFVDATQFLLLFFYGNQH